MRNRRLILTGWVVAVVAIGAIVIAASRANRRMESRMCASHMASIGYVAKLWADEHHGRLPADFHSLSNILNTPQIFVCPGDHAQRAATTWKSFTSANCSYELLSPWSNANDTNTAFFRCSVHGYLGYPDGTVFNGVRRRVQGD